MKSASTTVEKKVDVKTTKKDDVVETKPKKTIKKKTAVKKKAATKKD